MFKNPSGKICLSKHFSDIFSVQSGLKHADADHISFFTLH